MGFARPSRAALALGLSAVFISGATASNLSQPEIVPVPIITPTSTIVQRAVEPFTTVTGCHAHGDDAFCLVGENEYQIIVPPTATGEIQPTYTGCHSHGSEVFCFGDDDIEIEVLVEESEGDHDHGHDHDHDHDHDHEAEDEHDHEHEGEEAEESHGENCHFHAGVEHCVGDHSSSGEAQCERRDREYNIPLRIGLVFAMLAVGFIGVGLPIFLKPLLPGKFQIIFTILKQFGTGVIVATALIHLFTHATLMFANQCLGELQYEAVTAAIVLAGLFIAFLVESTTHRVAKKFTSAVRHPDDVVSVSVLEAGIIFHSLLVGLTLVVAGDSFFITLFVVIVFHQGFEGIALGTRIAAAGQMHADAESGFNPESLRSSKEAPELTVIQPGTLNESGTWKPLSMLRKLIMATAFAVVTPIGMAIGIGVLQKFNGNDPSTIIAIGTLDALSAGILLWVGLVEMWATDWLFGGELEDASSGKRALAGSGLVAGFILMGLLGKWA